jgi:hypothetical protein
MLAGTEQAYNDPHLVQLLGTRHAFLPEKKPYLVQEEADNATEGRVYEEQKQAAILLELEHDQLLSELPLGRKIPKDESKIKHR